MGWNELNGNEYGSRAKSILFSLEFFCRTAQANSIIFNWEFHDALSLLPTNGMLHVMRGSELKAREINTNMFCRRNNVCECRPKFISILRIL